MNNIDLMQLNQTLMLNQNSVPTLAPPSCPISFDFSGKNEMEPIDTKWLFPETTPNMSTNGSELTDSKEMEKLLLKNQHDFAPQSNDFEIIYEAAKRPNKVSCNFCWTIIEKEKFQMHIQ